MNNMWVHNKYAFHFWTCDCFLSENLKDKRWKRNCTNLFLTFIYKLFWGRFYRNSA